MVLNSTSLAEPPLSEGSAVARIGWSASRAVRCPLRTVGSALPYHRIQCCPQLPDEPWWHMHPIQCRVASARQSFSCPFRLPGSTPCRSMTAGSRRTCSAAPRAVRQGLCGRTGASWLVS